ncbi:MAG: GTP-binding protein, partial [Caldiserica bacterium]|nr:GTP-binding protein [Caldisericota bacterium]
MKVFETSAIRNVVLCSHGSSGKTSWVEAAAYDTGITDRMGTVSAGNTISDFDQDEAKRQISINLSVVPLQYKDVKINFIDTPGSFDFQGDAISGIRAADASIIFVDVISGIQVGTEKMWSLCDNRNLPRAIIINKVDRENANFDQALDQITEGLTKNGLVMTFPIGEGLNFKGVIDVIKGKAYTFTDNGKKFTEGDIPANLTAKRDEYYEKLVEVVSESDDELLEMFLEGKKPTPEQLNKVLHESVKTGKIYPIFASSGLTNVGVQNIMDAIVELFPAPNQRAQEEATDLKSKSEIKLVCDSAKPFASLVFKTSADPFVGRITYFKVMQGTLNTDVKPYNTKK